MIEYLRTVFPGHYLAAAENRGMLVRCLRLLVLAIFLCYLPGVTATVFLEGGATAAVRSNRDTTLYPSNHSSLLYRRYFELGARTGATAAVVADSIVQFEVEIAMIYERLAQNEEFRRYTKDIGKFDKIILYYRLRKAANDISAAQRRLIAKVGLQDAELQPLLSTPFVRYGGVEVFPRPAFSYLLAGLSRRVGSYIRVDNEVRVISRDVRITFPRYCFSSVATNYTSLVSKEIGVLLKHPSAISNSLTNTYDVRVKDVNITTLGESTGYNLSGKQDSCPIYGEIDNLSGRPSVVLYEESVSKFPVPKRHPYLLKTFRKSNQIHEELHYISLRPCKIGSENIDNAATLFRDRQLSEAQASIGTLAVFAANNDGNLFFVLIDHLDLSVTREYRLLFDLFYAPLFKGIVEKDFERLKTRARSGLRLSRSDMPRYIDEGRLPVSADQGHFLGMLTVEGTAKPFFTSLSYDKFKTEYSLVTAIPPGQVLSSAVTALGAVRNEQNVLCTKLNIFNEAPLN